MNLNDAIKKRDDFLKNNPHLQSRQDDLDLAMENLSSDDRLLYLSARLTEKLESLKENMESLKGIITHGNIQ